MFTKSGFFLFLLTAYQIKDYPSHFSKGKELKVSARYQAVEPISIENEVDPEQTAVASSSSRIVSGWEAQPGQFPYHAALRTVATTGGLWRYGGAIVSKEWVITVAQSTVNLRSVTVRVGLSFNNPDSSYESTEWYIHPTYNNLSLTAQANDIALLKVQRPIVYTNLVKPIRIQPSADAYRNYDGEQVHVSGHGRIWTGGDLSDTLKWVYLRAISNSECSRTFSTSVFTATTICARYYNVTSQSPCNGDFGGPLVHTGSDGVPTLIGVFSFRLSGNDACHSGRPFGYVRPGPYLSWFEEVTEIDFENLHEEETTTTTTTTTTTLAPTTTTTTLAPTTTTTTLAPTTTTTTLAPTTTTTTLAPTTTTTTLAPTTTTTTLAPTTTTTTLAPTTTTTTLAPTTTTTTLAPTTTTTTLAPITTTTAAPTTTTTTTAAPTTTTTTTTAPTTTTTTTAAPTTTTPTTTTSTTTTTTTAAPTTTTSTTPIPTTTPTTTTTVTTPIYTTTPSPTTTPTPSTTTTELTTTPEDSGEGDDDSSDNDDDVAQLLKRLQVFVKVKVRMDKYNSAKGIGMKVDHHQQ